MSSSSPVRPFAHINWIQFMEISGCLCRFDLFKITTTPMELPDLTHGLTLLLLPCNILWVLV